MPTFRNVNSGQVIEIEADPSHFDLLARWERIEEGPSAPVIDPSLAFVVHGPTVAEQARVELVDAEKARVELEKARADAETGLAEAVAELSPTAQQFIDTAPVPPAPVRPADDAERKDWMAYAKARGKTDADLKGVRTADIREMFAE